MKELIYWKTYAHLRQKKKDMSRCHFNFFFFFFFFFTNLPQHYQKTKQSQSGSK